MLATCTSNPASPTALQIHAVWLSEYRCWLVHCAGGTAAEPLKAWTLCESSIPTLQFTGDTDQLLQYNVYTYYKSKILRHILCLLYSLTAELI